MGSELELSYEQGELLNAGTQPALDTLYETGNFLPTLYVHDGENVTFFNIAVLDLVELRKTALQVMKSQENESVSYALFYSSTIETENDTVDALLVETGDVEDEAAYELARSYSREDRSAGPLAYLGEAPHLLNQTQVS